MKPQPRKECPRCGKPHSRKGARYCDPCENAVIAEMRATKYLEDRHMKNNERATRPTGAR
jgi:uncharacterized Zn finger protein (UPF0148 family)